MFRLTQKDLTMHKLAIIFMITGCALATPALADKGGHGKGHGNSKHEIERSHHGDVRISSSDRVIIRHYIVEDYHSHCPPGLAKKHNGCLPPGQAKKRYTIGQPYYGAWDPLPGAIIGRLGPVPDGYRYIRVDQDVLLMAEASHKIIDAITLLSAVGH